MRDLMGNMLNEGQKVVIDGGIMPKLIIGTLAKVGGIPVPHPQAPQGVVDIVVIVEVRMQMVAGTPVVPHLVVAQMPDGRKENVIELTEKAN